ncbi:g-type lectin s-receptor-like serine/threonine-protein kinase [Quercus suber]|uniref:G-type lectin s-receptor-like serine/threonine-protein kinase n=1 Tax=Quercus suber TaxID=58331 RepID=A0AAW0IH05_QUESU
MRIESSYQLHGENMPLGPMNVGLLCVQEFAQDRPTVSIVVSMLKSEIVDMPHPKKLAFTERQITDSSQRSQTKCFVNNVTVTMVQG